MDVLSDVIATMRTGEPAVGRAGADGGGWRFASYEGTGFHIVLEGHCWLVPRKGRATALGVGDVVLFPRGEGHALAFGGAEPPTRAEVRAFPRWDPASGDLTRPEEDTRSVVLCGKYRRGTARAHPLLHEMPDTVHIPARMGRNEELRGAVDLLARETRAPRSGSGTLVTSLLDAVFVYLVRAWLDERPEAPAQDGSPAAAGAGWRRALTDPVCVAALDAMHGDPARPWTLHELSGRAGVSRATLTRRFTALAGQPPMAYLTWWRLMTAARLLSATDAPVQEIAHRVGYGSPFSLSHAFKREFGQAPHRYRGRYAEAGEGAART
ncbi:AraC family transcriptional regulator [Streptomyces sp. ODS28]|uniref:AraC family transcriptional regulator n=1 Tax=Streptomyces sp. ODS28 TaxID=3136688 RepID=UPI0031E753D9